MTRRHLISFAYVSCPCGSFCPRLWSNLYFYHSQNSQKKSHKFFGAYLHQICKNPSLPSSKLIQQYSFAYVLFIYSWLPSEFLGTLSYPNYYRMTKFSFICLANLPQQISKVFVHLEALWRKYLFYISKWHEIYTVPSYAQIITLLQIAAQSNHLCDTKFNLYFMDKLARCKASVI